MGSNNLTPANAFTGALPVAPAGSAAVASVPASAALPSAMPVDSFNVPGAAPINLAGTVQAPQLPNEIPGASLAYSSPEEAVAATVAVLAQEGLALQPDASLGLIATTTKPMALGPLVGALFGVPAQAVTANQAQAVVSTNPELAALGALSPQTVIPAGSRLSVAQTPAALVVQTVQVLKLGRLIDGLITRASVPNPAPADRLTPSQFEQLLAARQQVQQQLALTSQAYAALVGAGGAVIGSPGARPASAVDAEIQRTEQGLQQAAALLTDKGELSAGMAAFDQLDAQLGQQLQSAGLSADDQGKLIEESAKLRRLEGEALSSAAKLPKLDGKPSAADRAKVDEVQRAINRCYDRASSRLALRVAQLAQAGRAGSPADAQKALQAKSDTLGRKRRYEAGRHMSLSALAMNVGDAAQAKAEFQKFVLQAIGVEPPGGLSVKNVTVLAAQVKCQTGSDQALSLKAMDEYAQLCAKASDKDGMELCSKLMHRLADELHSPAMASRAAWLDGILAALRNDLPGARQGFTAAMEQARAAAKSDPLGGLQLLSSAALGLAHLDAAQTLMGSHDDRLKAAKSLQSLRLEAEQPGRLITKRDQATLGFLEAEAWLNADDSEQAKKALSDLAGRFGADPDVPWVRKALEDFNQQNHKGGALAALQVALHQMNDDSGQDVLLELGVMGAGAVVGGLFGGLAGVAIGSTIGTALGTGALKIRDLIRGAPAIAAAKDTGLASETWTQSVFDGGMDVLDVGLALAPLGGFKALGRSGVAIAMGRGSEATAIEGAKSAGPAEQLFRSLRLAPSNPFRLPIPGMAKPAAVPLHLATERAAPELTARWIPGFVKSGYAPVRSYLNTQHPFAFVEKSLQGDAKYRWALGMTFMNQSMGSPYMRAGFMGSFLGSELRLMGGVQTPSFELPDASVASHDLQQTAGPSAVPSLASAAASSPGTGTPGSR